MSNLNEEIIWNKLKDYGLTTAGIAGVMGNLYAESGLIPNNLQNTYEVTLGFTDAHYTESVDNGSYTNFIHDSAGYGLAQWTYYTRKQGLYNMAKAKGKSIGDLDLQLDWLLEEFNGYTSMMNILRTTNSVREASDIVLLDFERPANQSDSVKIKRAEYSQVYYDKYAGVNISASSTTSITVAGKGPSDTTGNPLSRDWKISSGFQTASRPTHNGVDLVPADGIHPIDVHAVWSGTVTKVEDGYGDGYYGCNDGGQLGNHIIYKTDDGHYVLNGHMLKGLDSSIHIGAKIVAGQRLGTMGTSGSSTGKHLHYEIRTGANTNFWSNTPLDPNASLSQGTVVLEATTDTIPVVTETVIPITVQSLTTVQVATIQTKRESKTVLDLKTGLKFNVSWAAAKSYHSDFTPMTSADTDVIKEILKRSGSNCNWTTTGAWSWDGRPGVLFLNDSTYVACGYHLRPHAAIMGGNPGSPFTNQSNTRPAAGWAIGGHMCMYYGDSVGGTPSCNTAAKEAVTLGNAYFNGQTTTVTPTVNTTTSSSVETSCSYIVQVTASALNCRSGPGTNNSITYTIRDKGAYTIVAESTGAGASKWGKLKSGVGWISLDYVSRK